MKISIINAGIFALDGGAMFGVVPKALWQRAIAADDNNRIPLGLNVLLIETKDKKIIVDTGMGDKWNEKSRHIYRYDASSLMSNLDLLKIRPDQITDIIITHMHFDHIGGLTVYDKENRIIPAFPKATCYINRRQWDWANAPSPRDKASYNSDNYACVAELGLLQLLDGPEELFPGIEIINVEGHTPGQQLLLIANTEGTYLYAGDLIPTVYHLPLPYVMGYDLYPLKTMAEKANLLEKARQNGWQLIFEHNAKQPLWGVDFDGKNYVPRPSEDKLTTVGCHL
jgi:glyoxylase-like metal-dependent hydrolase (beta-lactamase superfamily II)